MLLWHSLGRSAQADEATSRVCEYRNCAALIIIPGSHLKSRVRGASGQIHLVRVVSRSLFEALTLAQRWLRPRRELLGGAEVLPSIFLL
jgi:hypothetical protein